MNHSSAHELFQYWNRLRGGDKAPKRGALEPSEIRGILGDTFLLERLGPADYRFRLAGTRICSAYCRELKGLDFLEFWKPADRTALADLLSAITTEAAAGSLTIAAENDRGQAVSLEALLLPLRHTDTELNRIIGVLAPINPPYWLGIHPIASQKIANLSLFRPDVDRTVVALPTRRPPPSHMAPSRLQLVVVQGGKN